MEGSDTGDVRDVIVAVCTYNRNTELDHLIRMLLDHGRQHWSRCRMGMTVIDDSQDGNARATAERYTTAFPLGLVYENSASRNIAIARNLALTRSMDRAPWIAMTDDDCEPSEVWLSELVRVAEMAGADVSTGLMLRRAPPDAPSWIVRQPFLELGEFEARDGQEMAVANTNNSLISSRYLIDRPELRFDPEFGRIGGEDMRFFHAMKESGAKIVYASDAIVFENEPPSRLTLRYQYRRYLWHGNSSAVTRLHKGVGRLRIAVNGVATMVRGVVRPARQLAGGRPAEFRYAVARICEGVGILIGVIGIKVKHK